MSKKKKQSKPAGRKPAPPKEGDVSNETVRRVHDAASSDYYGIDQETFVICWETSGSREEACAKMAAHSRKQNLPAMPLPILSARASSLRNAGINLQRFQKGRKKKDRGGLNVLIEEIHRKKESGIPFHVPEPEQKFALPPEQEDRIIAEVVRRLITALGGRGG